MFARQIVTAALWLLLIGIVSAIEADAQSQPASQPIKDGSTVNLEYTLTEPGGTLIESNKGKDPLVYTQGRGQIVPGLEKALLGMRQGETKHVAIPPRRGVRGPEPSSRERSSP
jgi:FKBP-type peptidyl-prolyl cis-trans isomerase